MDRMKVNMALNFKLIEVSLDVYHCKLWVINTSKRKGDKILSSKYEAHSRQPSCVNTTVIVANDRM